MNPFAYILIVSCWIVIILAPMALLNAAGEMNGAQMTIAGFFGGIMGVAAGLMWCGVAKIQDQRKEIEVLQKKPTGHPQDIKKR